MGIFFENGQFIEKLSLSSNFDVEHSKILENVKGPSGPVSVA